MAALTDWETDHLRNVYLLLKQAADNIKELEGKEDDHIKSSRFPSQHDVDDMTFKLRYILFDLYSVLDYIYFMLYCHFSNNGKPDYSRKGIQFGFPGFKPNGAQPSFVKDKMKKLFGEVFGEKSHFWNEIGDLLLSMQPVDATSAQLADTRDSVAQESFALLHYYRNCTTHKSSVQFVSRRSLVEINQVTREIKLVNEQCKKEGYFYRELDKAGYWINLPSDYSTVIRNADQPRLLLEVLQQLLQFVKGTSSELLSSSLLLPKAKDILKYHMEGCTIATKYKPAEGFQIAEVTATVQDTILKMESSRQKLQPEAEEEACVLLLKNLAAKEQFPNPPYSYFTLKLVRPMPPTCTVKKTPLKTCRMVLNELKQQLLNQQITLTIEPETGPAVEEQHFRAKATIRFKKVNDTLCTLNSHEQTARGKDAAIEEACKEIVDKADRLGILKLTISS